MSGNDITARRLELQRRIDELRATDQRRPSFSMADFRDEMKRRGVYERPDPRLDTPADRALRRAKYVANKRAMQKGDIDRVHAAMRESRRVFYAELVHAIRARLSSLVGKPASETLMCPWSRFAPCDATCRCGGRGEVSVGWMRTHCKRMLEDYARLA